MKIDDFSNIYVKSNIINAYVAASFFATTIYFIININLYTPIEIIGTIILVTVTFKGLANIMFSLVIAFFNLENKEEAVAFSQTSTRINGLLDDLSLQESKLKSKIIQD
jgi:hypothetical protein